MKKKNTARVIICVFLLTLSINPIAFSSFSSDGTNNIILNYSFEAPAIKEISINEYTFSHVSISSCEQSEPAGEPSLPVKAVSILLPPHSSVKSINVERNNLHRISNVKNIELGPSVFYPLGEENNMVLSAVDPDNNLYSFVDADYKDNIIPKYDITRVYPENHFKISGVGYKKGFPILVLNLYPVEYDTLSGTVNYCTSMTVKVNLQENCDAIDTLYRGTITDKKAVIDLVDNPSTMSLYSSELTGTGRSILNSMSDKLSTQSYGSNMLIITTEKLKNAAAPYNLQALAAAHKSRDMNEIYIETVESIYSQYKVDFCPVWATFISGDSFYSLTKNFNGLEIRECIRDYYLHNNVDYVLLVGDDDYNWKNGIMFMDGCPPTSANLLRANNKADQNEVPTFQLYLYSTQDVGVEMERDENGNITNIRCRLIRGSYVHKTTASDLPYGCLDNESTLIFPSIPGANVSYFPDLYSEISVGRAPVSNENDLRNFVKKTISYLQASPDQYSKVLMTGEFLGFGGVADFADDALNELINSCSNHGYTTVGIPSDKYTIQTLSDYDADRKWEVKWPSWPSLTFTWKWFGSDLISCVNNGSIGYINHLGHANINGTMKLGTPEYFENNFIWERDLEPITGFNNTYYPIVYSQGCFCAAFDSGSPFYSDCIAEYLTVKTNDAAVAFIGNSFFGFGEGYSTDGPSQRYNRQFIDAIFGEGKTRIGDANQDSKEDNINSFDDQRLLWLYYCINLLGDPALKFKIAGENEVPIANAGGPYSGNIYQTITFDGSASYDPDGTIISYNWDFGDGTVGTGTKPSHAYSNIGTYNVYLTVNDDQNDIDSATAEVTITSIPTNHPPLVSDETPDDSSYGLSTDICSLSVVISDSDGDAFDWSIQTSPNIGSASGFNEHNGIKTMVITSELQYNTTYIWYVNVTDGIAWTKTIYTFTTKNLPAGSGETKVDISSPTKNYLYIRNMKICPLFTTLVIGSLEINATIDDTTGNVTTIKFIIDDKDVSTFSYNPSMLYYNWMWNQKVFLKRINVKVLAVDVENKEVSSDEINVLVINFMLKKT